MHSVFLLYLIQTNLWKVSFKILAAGKVSKELKKQLFVILICLRRFCRWRLAPISLPRIANFLNIREATMEPKFSLRKIQQTMIEFRMT